MEKIDIILWIISSGFVLTLSLMTLGWNALSKKIDDVEIKLTKKIDDVEMKLTKKIDDVEAKLDKKIDKLDEKLTDIDRRVCRIEGAMYNQEGCAIRASNDMRKAE